VTNLLQFFAIFFLSKFAFKEELILVRSLRRGEILNDHFMAFFIYVLVFTKDI